MASTPSPSSPLSYGSGDHRCPTASPSAPCGRRLPEPAASLPSPACGVSDRRLSVLSTFQSWRRSTACIAWRGLLPAVRVRAMAGSRIPRGLCPSGLLRSVDRWPLARDCSRFLGVSPSRYPLTLVSTMTGLGRPPLEMDIPQTCQRLHGPRGFLSWISSWGTQWGQMDGPGRPSFAGGMPPGPSVDPSSFLPVIPSAPLGVRALAVALGCGLGAR